MAETSRTGKRVLPLAGVRIADFSRLLPGPWCSQLLGDFGADVIKVEQPEIGDYSRHNPPGFRDIYWGDFPGGAPERGIIVDEP